MNTNTASASYVNAAHLTSLTDAARTIAADLEGAVDRLARALAVEIASHESGRLQATSVAGHVAVWLDGRHAGVVSIAIDGRSRVPFIVSLADDDHQRDMYSAGDVVALMHSTTHDA